MNRRQNKIGTNLSTRFQVRENVLVIVYLFSLRQSVYIVCLFFVCLRLFHSCVDFASRLTVFRKLSGRCTDVERVRKRRQVGMRTLLRRIESSRATTLLFRARNNQKQDFMQFQLSTSMFPLMVYCFLCELGLIPIFCLFITETNRERREVVVGLLHLVGILHDLFAASHETFLVRLPNSLNCAYSLGKPHDGLAKSRPHSSHLPQISDFSVPPSSCSRTRSDSFDAWRCAKRWALSE